MSIPSYRKFSADFSVLKMRNTMSIIKSEIQHVVATNNQIVIQTEDVQPNPF